AVDCGERWPNEISDAARRLDRINCRLAWENARDGTLCDVCGPVAIDGTDDLEFRMLLHAFFDAGMDIVIDGNTGKAANFEQVAAIREALGKIVDLSFTHRLEIDRDAPSARLGHDAVEGNDRDACIAGFLDRAIQ